MSHNKVVYDFKNKLSNIFTNDNLNYFEVFESILGEMHENKEIVNQCATLKTSFIKMNNVYISEKWYLIEETLDFICKENNLKNI